MASSFSVQLSALVVPIETVPFTDSSQTSRGIHSGIDKSLSSSIEKVFGSSANNVGYASYTSSTSESDLGTISGTGLSSITLLFIRITGAVSSGTPDLQISIDDTVTFPFSLSGIGDFCIIPIVGTDPYHISVKSSGLTTRSYIDIIYAGA